MGGAKPTAWIDGAVVAHRRFAELIRELTDDDVRAPSALPDWSRGHVLTHIARNADAMRWMAEAARAGGTREMYPGGPEERVSDIDAGSGRSADELRADVAAASHALEQTWAALPDQTWERGIGHRRAGPMTIADFVFLRWREVTIHTIDLGLPAAADPLEAWRALDPAYVDEEWRRTTADLADRVPKGTTLLLAPGDRPSRAFGDGPDVVVAADPAAVTLAWLTGRNDGSVALAAW